MSTKGKLIEKPWQEKVNSEFHIRRPRTGVEYVETLLDSSLPPTIFLVEDHKHHKHTDIVIRFPATSHKLPDRVRTAYFTADFTLEKAFEDVLRRFSKTDDERVTRAELARVAYTAFRSTWIYVLTTRYLHQFHPQTDEWLQTGVERLKDSSNKRKGRSKESPSDRRNLEQKYQEMLAIAIFFHDTAMKVVAEHPQVDAVSTNEITKKIWEATTKYLSSKLYGARAAELVFSGRAFNIMADTIGGAALVRPAGWQPEDLALILLNLDEPKPYCIVKHKLRPMRSKKRTKSS
jgi:hypothetical protein